MDMKKTTERNFGNEAISVKLVMDELDGTIADLMTDGCIKSLNRYLNQYRAADEKTKKHYETSDKP